MTFADHPLSAHVMQRFGVKCVVIGTTVQGAAIVLLPLAHTAPPAVQLAATVVLYAISACSNATGVTTSTVATNRCAARHPHRRGAINGIATTIESVAKAIGPIAGASLFAAAVELDSIGAVGGAGIFFLVYGCVLGGSHLVVGLLLPGELFGPPNARRSAAAGGSDPAHLAPTVAEVELEVEPAAASCSSCRGVPA